MGTDDGAEHGDAHGKFRVFFQNHIPQSFGIFFAVGAADVYSIVDAWLIMCFEQVEADA